MCCPKDARPYLLLFHPAVGYFFILPLIVQTRYLIEFTVFLQVVLKDLRGMACMIGEAVAEGLRSLEPAHHDTKRGFRAANKALHLVLDLTNM